MVTWWTSVSIVAVVITVVDFWGSIHVYRNMYTLPLLIHRLEIINPQLQEYGMREDEEPIDVEVIK